MKALAILTLGVLSAANAAQAQVTVYTDEAEFLADLAALGYVELFEGFEDDAAWGSVRTTVAGGPMTAPSVVHQGVTWTANHPDGEVTTGSGAAVSGSYGFFTLPHGSFLTGVDCQLPGNCGDGWVGTASGRLHAVGGWVETNTGGAKLGIFLDGAAVDLGEACDPTGEICTDLALLGYAPRFFGVIDSVGFRSFEFRELEGTAGDVKLVFSDDFTLGFVPTACSDGVDNDGDGRIDWDGAGVAAPDPQCNGRPFRNAESSRSCGLGPGMALLLPVLLGVRLRRASRDRS